MFSLSFPVTWFIHWIEPTVRSLSTCFYMILKTEFKIKWLVNVVAFLSALLFFLLPPSGWSEASQSASTLTPVGTVIRIISVFSFHALETTRCSTILFIFAPFCVNQHREAHSDFHLSGLNPPQKQRDAGNKSQSHQRLVVRLLLILLSFPVNS